MTVLPTVPVFTSIARSLLFCCRRLSWLQQDMLGWIKFRQTWIIAPDKFVLNGRALLLGLLHLWGWQLSISSLFVIFPDRAWDILRRFPSGLLVILPLDMVFCSLLRASLSKDLYKENLELILSHLPYLTFYNVDRVSEVLVLVMFILVLSWPQLGFVFGVKLARGDCRSVFFLVILTILFISWVLSTSLIKYKLNQYL